MANRDWESDAATKITTTKTTTEPSDKLFFFFKQSLEPTNKKNDVEKIPFYFVPVALVNLKQFFVLFTCLLISGNFHSKWKISPNMKQTFIHSKNKVKPKWYDRKKKKKKKEKKKYDVDG